MKKPKILFFDLETKPVKFWGWRTGKQFIGHKQIVEGEKFDIICLAYKWDHEKTIHAMDWGIKKQDSTKMVAEFSKIVESADIVVAQNGDSFDVKQLNFQRLLKRQGPINWPTTEDTRKMMRKHFYVTSSSLDYITKTLFGAGKDRMEFDDWIDIVEKKNPKALAKMIKYCKRDVKLLADTWNELKVYCEPKAHAGIISGQGRDSCGRCGSTEFVRDGFKIKTTGRYQRFQCKKCGFKWADSRKTP